ncbi:DUF1330 domain-containing protein [Novosphingobium sp.]|uniref:DUF1330 domain-containing protein n=1 Tax=Novosphingobium sp. TaxID=1874826 RepID=UPI0022C3BF4A|nr:DUF1330 domain-containing protein [Novosphingobium sp.]MCZ8019206.1 DUF1330 domain-containing protein [Novosphingobium sp.]MCZ8035014.1 DUF1330 domain-containing protein [Novosphingobium sp.]MCZ8052582.1 DUF1330 domain-containing protein [Novosphingobium sp.]MCZ8058681.1 DUF1330 domain-containing protein [Novosphingobium sp.]MCZ8233078.1 DUF1330 domain-containing protein [Novosphingobium sp.]
MSAYIIFIKEREHDAAAMATYGQKAGGTLAGHPGKPLAFYGATETLEGAEAAGCVLIEFPDMEAARAWYNSPAYQDARKHRFQGADYRVVLTQGL